MQPKRKNVGEQVEERLRTALTAAKYDREHFLKEAPQPVIDLARQNGIDPDCDLVIHSDMSSYEDVNAHEVFAMTTAGKFFELQVNLTDNCQAVEWWQLTDVTGQYPIKEHQPGIGVSDGWIYSTCLAKINASI